jgi:DNA mismatch repair ATPase MutS
MTTLQLTERLTTFHSILFEKAEDIPTTETVEAPDFFVDLNLDQIVANITLGKQDYNLKPFFYTPLSSIEAIVYRHEIMQDLENKILFEAIKTFAQSMRSMHEHLAQAKKLYYKYQKERWFLDAVEIYGNAIHKLLLNLTQVDLKSRGFLSFRDYLARYVESDTFTALLTETETLKAALSTVKYCLLIQGNCVTVRKYEPAIDYSTDVEETFDRFKQGAIKDYKKKFYSSVDMNHIEAQILELVAKLYPNIFFDLDNYCTRNSYYLNSVISIFEREIQFYIAYLEFVSFFSEAGLSFCYPKISSRSKDIYDYDGFDVALAYKLIHEDSTIVCNHFCLQGNERIFVVSGPNQGGKTTFARTFGQLHYLASLGCPVPGSKAQLFLFDKLFTHFEKEEKIENLRGKLQDDLIRIHAILNQATSNSIIIMNEIFTSTTLEDAIFLGRKVIEKIIQMDSLSVFVTFIDELSTLSEQTVSMVSTVAPENPALRTYQVVRSPANGLSYAITIVEKYGLTYDAIKERIKS